MLLPQPEILNLFSSHMHHTCLLTCFQRYRYLITKFQKFFLKPHLSQSVGILRGRERLSQRYTMQFTWILLRTSGRQNTGSIQCLGKIYLLRVPCLTLSFLPNCNTQEAYILFFFHQNNSSNQHCTGHIIQANKCLEYKVTLYSNNTKWALLTMRDCPCFRKITWWSLIHKCPAIFTFIFLNHFFEGISATALCKT